MYDWFQDIESQVVATNDLSGCTVVVIASPFASFMVHVWERRANEDSAWLLAPQGAEQQAQDIEFLAKARELINMFLDATGGTLENGYNGWFPIDSTTVQVVAPAANPDYDPLGNPWYTFGDARNPMRLIYRPAAETLMQLASTLVIPDRMATQARIHSYRRRYSNDPLHGTDDREFIILKPLIMDNGEVWLQMLYDDDKGWPIARLA